MIRNKFKFCVFTEKHGGFNFCILAELRCSDIDLDLIKSATARVNYHSYLCQ